MIFDLPSSASATFFDERITIEAVRPGGLTLRGTFAACVMPAERVDPFAENDAVSKLFKRTVLVAKTGEGGWNLTTDPQVGDSVTISGKSWKVTAVDPFCDQHFTIEVRSC